MNELQDARQKYYVVVSTTPYETYIEFCGLFSTKELAQKFVDDKKKSISISSLTEIDIVEVYMDRGYNE